jgi:L-threonylcarbamoyladenylate synthase
MLIFLKELQIVRGGILALFLQTKEVIKSYGIEMDNPKTFKSHLHQFSMDFVEDIKHGAIFIYPTDTIYGLGCDATNEDSVQLIKDLKYKDKDKPMSVIAPSVAWIKEHCEVSDEMIEKYLPGPYTLILKKKDPEFLIQVSSIDTLGIRIPDCEFTKLVEKSGVPFITTSVNFAGEPYAVQISDIDKKILDSADIIMGVGMLDGRPSTLVIDGKEIKR